MAEDRDYEVGYGKPPKHSQFKPGSSGNRKGRPKGARGLKTDLEEELKSRHTIHINRTPVTASKQRLMIKTLATRAATGDLKAAQILLPMIIQILGSEDRGTERRALSAQDQSILDDFLRHNVRERDG
ncbi:DUF5681 domain-containing protein [Sphingobium tyrosinilyticum]|uniref:DUF5681 domain-containing protein n=1 Tax=Sphingobium tyrosinilyticum TaxID=2715436 RepID=A0ABV9F430_9SPHN